MKNSSESGVCVTDEALPHRLKPIRQAAPGPSADQRAVPAPPVSWPLAATGPDPSGRTKVAWFSSTATLRDLGQETIFTAADGFLALACQFCIARRSKADIFGGDDQSYRKRSLDHNPM